MTGNRRGPIKPNLIEGYNEISRNIFGPIMVLVPQFGGFVVDMYIFFLIGESHENFPVVF